jgi:hypothetical protein
MGFAAAAALCVLLLPADAWAWGPVTHVWYGAEAIRDPTNLPAALQRLLLDARWAYLYGCLAPDIIQAKRYATSIYDHCHSWRVGWRILGAASGDVERAFAYGYLSHLAADVYSHNHFVPTQLITSFPSRLRRHVYWEARFDAQFASAERRLLEEVVDRRDPRCDALVERVVDRTLFSFGTNRRIFHSVIALQQFDRWQEAIRRLTARSRFSLPTSEIERYKRICVAGIRDLLIEGEQSVTLRHDPTGHENIDRAKAIRRKMRMLRRRGMPIAATRREILVALEPELETEAAPRAGA